MRRGVEIVINNGDAPIRKPLRFLHQKLGRARHWGAPQKAIGAMIQMAFYFGEAVLQKLGWRAKIKSKFGVTR
jgi:hypothetical protein